MKTKKISKETIIGIILIVVFLPIIVINLVIFIKGIAKPTEFPMVFGTAPMIVESDSMTIDRKTQTGAFNKGDLIIIKKIDPNKLKVNDIITYYADDGSIITHRIVGMTDDDGNRITKKGEPAFETQGDFNSPAIMVIQESKVIGIYVGRIPKMGSVAMFLQTPLGVVVTLGIPFGIVVVIYFVKKKKDNKSAEEKIAELEAQLAAQQAKQQEQTNDNQEENNWLSKH